MADGALTNQSVLDSIIEALTESELKFLDDVKENILTEIAKNWLIDQGFSEEDLSVPKILEQVKKARDAYIKEKRKQLTATINEIKTEYKNFKIGIALVKAQVASIIANVLMPATITVPPGVPNPLHSVNEISQKKGLLNKIIIDLNISCVKMLTSANEIPVELPQSILTIMSSLGDLKKLLDTIPTPK